jgi:hypothetical protein
MKRTTIKDVNEVRRPRGRPRTRHGETFWEKIHISLGQILKDTRFEPDHKENVKLAYKGRLLDFKKHVIRLYNLFEAYNDEDLKKESRYAELYKRNDESTGGT